MINEYTFSPIKQTLSFGNNACITGVIINPNNTPLTLQVIDWNYSSNPITIPPNSKFHFQEMKVRQIKLLSGQGNIIYSLDTKNLDVGIENVTVQNVNIGQDYFIKTSVVATFNGYTIYPPILIGFVITLPPNTGIKIKNFNVQASPTFSPSLALGKAYWSGSYFYVTSVMTYTGNYGSFLINSISNNSKFCSQLKGSNNYIFIENANTFIYLTSYSSTSILCGNSSSKKILYFSNNNFNYSTFNFGNTTISFLIAYRDNVSGKYTFTGNWYISMLVETIPSYQTPSISTFKGISYSYVLNSSQYV